jgi:RNA 2',3'-cyclic 3'-phosphodiesterase
VSPSASLLRAFVAIELPEDVLLALRHSQQELASRLQSRAIRWTRPEGIHLTLKFLGDTSAELVSQIEVRLRESLAGSGPLSLALAPLGTFPDARAPRVVWIGLSGDLDALDATQRRVETAISPLGYPTERRPFSPHLTLARIADFASPVERRDIGLAVEATSPPPSAEFEVSAVSLIRSELGSGGARYSTLLSVPLG